MRTLHENKFIYIRYKYNYNIYALNMILLVDVYTVAKFHTLATCKLV